LARAFCVLDLGFFERQLFVDAMAAGAHLIMRLKSNVKVRVTGHLSGRRFVELPEWSLNYYLTSASRARGTLFDLDVIWGTGKTAVSLRLVGFAHKANKIRWYLTTVSRNQLSARQIVEAYRLRWLIELLFRELKQAMDFGRSFTANPHAVQVLTYGAMLAHVLVRSLRIQAALANDVPLEQLPAARVPPRCARCTRSWTRSPRHPRGVVTRHWSRCRSAASHRPGTQTVTLARSDCSATWRSWRLADRLRG
jgi:hypothetical protein